MIRFLFTIALLAGLLPCRASEPVRLKWGTFNIRYDNPGDGQNRWPLRKDSVAAFIRGQGFDVIGLQEVLHHQLQELAEQLPGYGHVGVCRDDGRLKGEAAPIFYDSLRFRALDSGTFWLSQHPDSIGFIGWDGACCRIATWAKLQERHSGRVFVAVNTHFDHVGTEARRQAALLIIGCIRQIAGERPAVLTGDFNVDRHSEAYRTLTTNPFVLNDAHRVAERTYGVAYSFHNWGRLPVEHRQQIDFIFATPSVRVLSAGIVQEQPDTGRPFLSDHNPVVAEVEL